ncbi:NifU family protein [uncultured Amphritea sp.]|uniref:NifU family protein n=1 Tax=uncultured Amphritea sp. TaxID=981605 RepID=UPI0025D4BD39|nr:NifU family protein [uncultured Amphritea sp.]
MQPEILISAAAINYLAQITEQEGNKDLRIGVSNPGTSISQCFITFDSEKNLEDAVLEYNGFNLSYEQKLSGFIDGLDVHYSKNRMGGKLRIKAPNMTVMPDLPPNADLSLRAAAALEMYVNPALAEHQGGVVVERIEGNKVFLKFGGNCLGCGNAERTLTEFVETTLKEHLPEIETVSAVMKH